jgi:hypothetical protein
VAAIPVSAGFGIAGVAPHWELRIETCASPPCAVDVDFTVGEISSSSDGETLWADEASPGFGLIAAYLADGVSGTLGWGVVGPISPSFAIGSVHFTTEALFFSSGSDLEGWSPSRIGFAVDTARIDSPGQDPNRNGIWTDVAVSGTFLFEALLFKPRDCMDEQWRTLRRPDLSPFQTLGDCIRHVVGGGPG